MVSIIIVNYKTCDLLLECVSSIFDKTKFLKYEVIVVDNNSNDGSVQLLKNTFQEVRILELDKNVGFGIANNLAADIAKGEYLFFLNSDTVLINNAVKLLYDFIISNSNSNILVCPNLFSIDLKPNTSFSNHFPSLIEELDFYFCNNLFYKLIEGKKSRFNYTQSVIEINGFISGAAFLISKENFLKINKFDSAFFMYYEDTDLCLRLKKLNFKFFSLPSGKIIHLEGGNKKLSIEKVSIILNSKYLYYKKHFSNVLLWALFLIISSACFLRIFLFLLVGNKSSRQFWKSYFTLNFQIFKKVI